MTASAAGDEAHASTASGQTQATTSTPAGRLVVVAGATSASGLAVCAALVDAGARTIGVGRDPGRLARLASHVPGVETWLCDLGDEGDVQGMVRGIHEEFGPVDALVNLVGGWRGGVGIVQQTDEDWEALSASLSALRHTSRALYRDLAASPAGRLAIVSSSAAAKPSAGAANYAALKAAAETWVAAVADGFARDGAAASTAIVVVDGALAGREDALGAIIAGLWAAPVASTRLTRITLD